MDLPEELENGRMKQVVCCSVSGCEQMTDDPSAAKKIVDPQTNFFVSSHHDMMSLAFFQGLILGKVLSVLLTHFSSVLHQSYKNNAFNLKAVERFAETEESSPDCVSEVICLNTQKTSQLLQQTVIKKLPQIISLEQPHNTFYFPLQSGFSKAVCAETKSSERSALYSLRSVSKSFPEKKKTGLSCKTKISKHSKTMLASSAATKPNNCVKRLRGSVQQQNIKCRSRGSHHALRESSPCEVLSNSVSSEDANVQEELKLQRKKNFSCKECQKTYTSVSYLIEHNRKWHKEKLTVSCKICSKQFSSWTGKTLHMRMKHKVEKPHECEFCGETFSCHKEYNAHKAHAHNAQNVVCHICGKKFKFRGALRPHLDAHFGIKRYFCEECGKGFVRVTSLYAHKTVEHSKIEEKIFNCSMCAKSFSAKWVLNHHLFDRHQAGPYALSLVRDVTTADSADCQVCRNLSQGSAESSATNQCPQHSSKLMFPCNLCSASFKTPNGLKVHLKLHTGIKAFSCSSCGKRFTTREYLKVHMMQHQEPKFECDICCRKFTYKSNMQKHLSVHSTAKPFQCDVCNKTFKLKSALTTHMRGHRPELAFTCNICGKGLTRSLHLRNHIKKMHPDTVLDG